MKPQYRATMFKARAALEALRCGIVSPAVTDLMASYGRDNELDVLKNHIQQNENGSSQILVGGYGVGKSHLLEILTQHLLEQGYAVAALELGSSNERAENPDAVLKAIEHSFQVKIATEFIAGAEGMFLLQRAMNTREFMPSRSVLDGMKELREHFLERFGNLTELVENQNLSSQIPAAMTAANRVVGKLVEFAMQLKSEVKVKGFVILFDEAERSEWAYTLHRATQAQNLMTWFATRSANKSTKALKTYRDEYNSDLQTSSFLHTIFAFTHKFGLAQVLSNRLNIPVIQLKIIDRSNRIAIAEQIGLIYQIAYNQKKGQLRKKLLDNVLENTDNEDIRLFTRTIVAALDHLRLGEPS